ncbi:hypothetical protein [Salininema proteolyticum]|uniref:Uncharacterized protein n=1 Tax=Salininema proteolyticum TaxID=1607685 RepID=A0ABV8TTN3_9ACTN
MKRTAAIALAALIALGALSGTAAASEATSDGSTDCPTADDFSVNVGWC